MSESIEARDNKLLDIIKREGNEYRWINGKTGYSCYIRRNIHSLTWNGYVSLPDLHPCYNSNYDNLDIDVHGGLTFGDKGVFGFDTAHAGDLMPAYRHFPRYGDEVYRTKEYVIEQVNKMAEQFKELEGC